MAAPKILTPIKDYCLNCEQHKWIKTNLTLNNQSGYICEECYNAHIWAYNEDNQRSHSLLNLLLHTKLYSSKKDGA